MFEKTKQAKQKNLEAQAVEEINLIINEVQIKKEGTATLKNIIERLKEDSEKTYIVKTTKTARLNEANSDITDSTGITNETNAIYVTNEEYGVEVEITKELKVAKSETIIDGTGAGDTGAGTGTEDVDTPQTNNPTLLSTISGADYGKRINYSVKISDTFNVGYAVLDDWKVFLKDDNNVYIILSDFLPLAAVPNMISSIGFTTTGAYVVRGTSSWGNSGFVEKLTTTNNWATIANRINGATATGTPTAEEFVASCNANPSVNTTTLSVNSSSVFAEDSTKATILSDSTGLYVRPSNSNCLGYWLATASSDSGNLLVMRIYTDGTTSAWRSGFASTSIYCGIRPLVKLPAEVTGTKNDTKVTIDSKWLN